MPTIKVEMEAGVWAECNGEDIDILNVPDEVLDNLTEQDSYRKRDNDYRYILTGNDEDGNDYKVTVAPDWQLPSYEHETWCGEFIKIAKAEAKGSNPTAGGDKVRQCTIPPKRSTEGNFKPGDRVIYGLGAGRHLACPGTVEGGPFSSKPIFGVGGVWYRVRLDANLKGLKPEQDCAEHTLRKEV